MCIDKLGIGKTYFLTYLVSNCYFLIMTTCNNIYTIMHYLSYNMVILILLLI